MRIIKFRAWDKKQNLMLSEQDAIGNGIYLALDGKVKRFIQGIDLDPNMWSDSLEIMQFTGVYDVNGKEIYEGDIIKHRYFSNKGIADVRWSNEQGYYLAIEPDGSRTMLRPNSEIIGNIFESPELLASNQ